MRRKRLIGKFKAFVEFQKSWWKGNQGDREENKKFQEGWKMILLEELKSVLKEDKRLLSDNKLLKNRIVELALKLDKDLIKLLLSNKKIKEHFFTEIDKTLVFEKKNL